MEQKDAFSFEDWAAYATCYDALLHLQPYRELIADTETMLAPASGECILDAGCGTGNLLLALSEHHLGVSLFGIDFSEPMLARAQEKLARTAAAFTHADLTHRLPFEDGAFDKICSVNVLYALTDPGASIREFHRVLAEEGTLVIATPKRGFDDGLILKAHAQSEKPDEFWRRPHDSPEREEYLIREAIAEEAIVAQMLYVARHNRKILATERFTFFDPETLVALCAANGFKVASLQSTYAGEGLLIRAQKEEP